MKKIVNRIIVLFLITTVCLSSNITVNARPGKHTDKPIITTDQPAIDYNLSDISIDSEESKIPDVKFEHTPTIDEDFQDDKVLVTLKHDYSALNSEINLEEFITDKLDVADSSESDSEREVASLQENNTGSTDEKIELDSVQDITSTEGKIVSDQCVDLDVFNQILKIELKTKGKEHVLAVIEELKKLDMVLDAEPVYNYEVKLDAVANDPKFSSDQWGLQRIRIQDAWNISTGSNSIKVGIMDTGIAPHEDLDGNVVSGNMTGYDMTSKDGYHGTFVAGVVGAVTNNGKGIAGTAQNVSLAPLSKDGNFAENIVYAAYNNIEILNASFGSYNSYSTANFNALQQYNNVLLICSAGNDSRNIDTALRYPACYKLSNTITVGASNQQDDIASFSNYGATNVELFAPGTDGMSTYPGNEYLVSNGTSYSAPLVAGVAALIKTVNPNLSAASIKSIIINNVDPVSALSGKCSSGGRLNAYKAVLQASYVGEGRFIHYKGRVYRMAGGAPSYVSSWTPFGGMQPFTDVSSSLFNSLRQYPNDGTCVSAGGLVYRFAGGAPIYVGSWSAIGGMPAQVITIDPGVLNQYTSSEPWNHVRQYPKDGTYVSSTAGHIYIFAGGAPLYVGSWNNLDTPLKIVAVDGNALSSPSNSSPWNHVRQYPADGTFVGTKEGYVYKFAGGAPIYVSSWNNVNAPADKIVTVDSSTLINYSTSIPWNHVRQYPADGTFVSTKAGKIYNFAGGASFYISTWDNVDEPSNSSNINMVDSSSLNPPSGAIPWNHVRQNPLNGTYVYTKAMTSRQATIFRFSNNNATEVFSIDKQSSLPAMTLVDMTSRYQGENFDNAYTWSLNRNKTNTIGLEILLGKYKNMVKFTAPVTGTYQISSSNCTNDLVGELYNSNRVKIAQDDDGGGSSNFKISYQLTQGQTYYVLARYYYSSDINIMYNLNILVP